MLQTTLVSEKNPIKKRDHSFFVVGDISVLTASTKIDLDLKADHKFFINSLFCEMIEKI